MIAPDRDEDDIAGRGFGPPSLQDTLLSRQISVPSNRRSGQNNALLPFHGAHRLWRLGKSWPDDQSRAGDQDDGSYSAHCWLSSSQFRRSVAQKGIEVLRRRWVVERTFGWMTRWRHLVRDYEARIDVSEAMILVAMGGNLLRRTTHP